MATSQLPLCVVIVFVISGGVQEVESVDYQYSLTASGADQYITSPDYPGNYPASSTSRWGIRAQTSGKRLFLEAVDSELESSTLCNWDYVRIYDGSSEVANELVSFCGTDTPSVYTTGENAYVIFVSDAYGSAKGFRMSYREVDQPINIGLVFGVTSACILLILIVIGVVLCVRKSKKSTVSPDDDDDDDDDNDDDKSSKSPPSPEVSAEPLEEKKTSDSATTTSDLSTSRYPDRHLDPTDLRMGGAFVSGSPPPAYPSPRDYRDYDGHLPSAMTPPLATSHPVLRRSSSAIRDPDFTNGVMMSARSTKSVRFTTHETASDGKGQSLDPMFNYNNF